VPFYVIHPSYYSFTPPSSYAIRPCFGPASLLVRSCFGCSSVILRLFFALISNRRISEERPKKQRICYEAGTKQSRNRIEQLPPNEVIRFPLLLNYLVNKIFNFYTSFLDRTGAQNNSFWEIEGCMDGDLNSFFSFTKFLKS
jgi:hypothetical protein